VDGQTYEVALRFRHSYKPYTLKLLEFRHDLYPGTTTPRNFSSKVRLVDEELGEDREVTISMNNPLRHRGETFYQADWNKETERGTVLQVVRNPGWLLPYFSCVIVALGMIFHFGLNLSTFLQRRAGG
jgi:cytochrome c biogenesis protein ResB